MLEYLWIFVEYLRLVAQESLVILQYVGSEHLEIEFCGKLTLHFSVKLKPVQATAQYTIPAVTPLRKSTLCRKLLYKLDELLLQLLLNNFGLALALGMMEAVDLFFKQLLLQFFSGSGFA